MVTPGTGEAVARGAASDASTRSGLKTQIDAARVAAQLRKWQERLLDLTRANPLLGINRSRVSKLRVTQPDAISLFDQLVVREETLCLPFVHRPTSDRDAPVDDEAAADYVVDAGDVAFDVKPLDLLRRLRRLYDNARTTVEERGVTTLHLAVGTLHWEDPLLGESVSPLWMVPCEFVYQGPAAPLKLQRTDEEMQVNPALALYLRERHQVSVPELPDEPTAESLQRFLEEVRGLVASRGWTVDDEVWLSTFNFELLVIYQDLKVLADVAAQHPVVVALARAGAPMEGSEALGEDLDALPTPEQVPVPIMDTDASQLHALTMAAAGRNLAIHGPPGTGKSQTISNLIATALGRGQTVLFVSAKMAALDVVHQRLAQHGLSRFCLEAHSTKAGKAKIIEDLKRTLDAPPVGGDDALRIDLEELLRVRSQLNTYVQALHARHEPLGLTMYQAVGQLAALRDVPALGPFSLPWDDVLHVSRSELSERVDALRALATQAAVVDAMATHPWRGLAVDAQGGEQQEALEVALPRLRALAWGLASDVTALSGMVASAPSAASLHALKEALPALSAVAACGALPPAWSQAGLDELEGAASVLDKAAREAAHLVDARATYSQALAVPVRDGLAALSPLRTEFGSWTRRLGPRYWRWRSSLRTVLVAGSSTRFGALQADLKIAEAVAHLQEWFAAYRAELAALVSADQVEAPDVLRATAAQYRAAVQLRTALRAQSLAPGSASVVTADMRAAVQSLGERLADANVAAAVAVVEAAWPSGFVDGRSVIEASVLALQARCDEVLPAWPRLHEWVVVQHGLAQCRTLGLAPLLEALGSVSVRQAPAAMLQRFYTRWVAKVVDGSSVLRLFTTEYRADLIERFRQLDSRVQAAAERWVQAQAAANARSVAAAQDRFGGRSEVGILRRELQKRRRIKPLRKLFAEIPHALQALKPCFLMSPLSVSTFLKPGSLAFDVVVFDEASQLPTPEAIPAILRAKQVVVAGDENQLPPTTFFEGSLIFDEESDREEVEEELEPLESLLDDCVAINPVFAAAYLGWHYRSRDERLICFSNHYFYDNRLVTFPSVSTSAEGRGVRLVSVPEGVWDRGRSRTNRVEARRVAEVVLEQLERYPERSVGVVALNTTQREAIEVALDERLEARPDLAPLLSADRAEPFFVKALENVQGDERDTMIISVGYAKTADGSLSLNFGPINRDGGWRRLNVLVTRAKWQTILVTSLRSQDLAGVNPNNRGALMLRQFIEYAEQGGQIPQEPARVVAAETNDFEEAIAEAIRARGFAVDEQVGVGTYRLDLAVRDPRDRSRYLLGVECDGATYHSARTARDRDLLRQQVLRGYGWRLHRIWSTDWFHDPEKALQGVLRSIEVAQLAPPEASVDAPADSDPLPTRTNAPPAATLGCTDAAPARQHMGGAPYRKYVSPRGPLDGAVLMDSQRVRELTGVVAAIIQAESPIHAQVLLDRLKEVCGVARAGSNIQENVEQATRLAVGRQGWRYDAARRFFYAGPVKVFRIPGDGVVRSIGEIPPEELELAALHVVEDQFGYSRDHIPQALAEVFDLGKTTAGVSEAVHDAVDGLVERGALRTSGPNLYLT